MSHIVRFAPSPTGFMHIGNARIAIINYLFCKKNKGKFLFRIDDTDTMRSRPEYEKSIKEDLNWLGICHDFFFRQSEKFSRYNSVRDKLIEDGVLYKCYESPEELEFKRKRSISAGKPPAYDRASLYLSEKEKGKLEMEGIKPYWRFKLPEAVISWDDLVMGHISYNLQNLSDPVIMKSDGTYLYSFCSVIDDIDASVTHIIRGQDHVTNTAAQIAMFNVIAGCQNYDIVFAHLSLLVNKDGSQFSKRIGSFGVKDLRDSDIDPMAICNVLAALGSSNDPLPITKMEELIERFDISSFSNNSPKFDISDINQINKKLIQKYTFEEVLSKFGSRELTPNIFETFKGNVDSIRDFQKWIDVCKPDYNIEYCEFSQEDKEFLKIALQAIDDNENIIEFLKQKTGRKGRELYSPLRKAISGMEHGPSLDILMTLLGKKTCYKRIKEVLSK